MAERLLLHLTEDERTTFKTTYRLDENAVPAEEVLLGPEGPARASDEPLHQALAGAAETGGLTDDERLLFAGSATHREIARGLLGMPPEAQRDAGVLCALRSFRAPPVGNAAAQWVEEDAGRAERVQRLRVEVAARLPENQVLRYVVEWAGTGPTFDEDALAEEYLGLLRPKVETVMASRTAARETLKAEGYDEATLANAAFTAQRADQVVGREDELARMAKYLASDIPLPLVVTGTAGSGKSTLLAEAAKRVATAQPEAILITRYLGVTPGTGSLFELLNDLHRTIARAYGQAEPVLLNDLEQLVGAFAAQLATLQVFSEHPLLLIVDALDQLDAQLQHTGWLPTRLAPHVRVVVSVLSDRREFTLLAARLPAEQALVLAPLSREVGQEMLAHLLATTPPRTLTAAQEEAVLAAFSAQGLPLHLRLAASEARRWRSFDPPLLRSLPETTRELIDAILARLEAPAWLGRVLVGNALGNLAVSRFGLAEDELLDLLAEDAAVRQELISQSPSSPQIEPDLPLPVALWARLAAEVEPLLTMREVDGVRLSSFYHQQLRSAVEARYLAEVGLWERHEALASYFAAQPWQLGPGQWNWRKVRELVPQQEGAGDRSGAVQALDGLAAALESAPRTPDGAIAIAELVNALHDHLFTGGYWQVGQRLHLLMLQEMRKLGDRLNEGVTLNNLGELARNRGRSEEAARYYEQALAIFREVGDRVREGLTLNGLGALAYSQGSYQEATRYFEQALVVSREVGKRAGEGATLSNLGTLARSQGRYGEAVRYYEQSLVIAREVGNRPGEGMTLGSLGTLAADQGRSQEASRYFEGSLAIAREVGDRATEVTMLGNLAAVDAILGSYQEAIRYLKEALVIEREVGDRAREGATLGNLGLMARRQEHYEEAARYYEQSLPILGEVNDRSGEAATLHNLAVVEEALGQLDAAEDHYHKALIIYTALGLPKGHAGGD